MWESTRFKQIKSIDKDKFDFKERNELYKWDE